MKIKPSSMILKNFLVSVAYFLGALIGDLAAASPNGSSPVWPAAGIALAAAFLYGQSVLFGILLGALSAQIYSFQDFSSPQKILDSLWVGAIIAAASTAQAFFGKWLLKINQVDSADPLIDDNKILRFILYGVFISSIIAPTIGTATLAIKGVITPSNGLLTWGTWWVGDAMGILGFTPITLILFAQPRFYWRQRLKTVLVPLIVFITLSFSLFLFSNYQVRSKTDERFQHNAAEVHAQLRSGFLNIAIDNQILKSFFDSSHHVDEKEFNAFASVLIARNPYVQALEWIPRVENQERNRFENSQSDEFAILDTDKDKRLIPASTRQEYFPIAYAYPLEQNQSVLGFDIANNRNAAVLIEKIKATRETLFSVPIHLVQDSGRKDIGFSYVVYSPVYMGSRKEKLQGIGAQVFRLKDMVESLLPQEVASTLYLSISDNNEKVYSNYTGSVPFGIEAHHLLTHLPIVVANKKLVVTYYPSTSFLNAQSSWTSWLVLVAGLCITGLSAIGLMMLTGRSLKSEELVKLRTSDLDKAKHKLEKQNLALFEALTKANEGIRAKDSFLASVSHELRTPLNSVLGFAQLLELNEKNNLSEEQKSWIGTILSSGEHLLNLINDILDFAGLSSGKLSFSMQRVELSRLTENCLKSLQSALDNKKITVETELIPCHVMADETRLKQVLLNLLTNAVKYNRENGRVWVRLVVAENNLVRLSVEDTGIGIPESRKDEVFQPFNRMGREGTHSEGTGIGLIISKTLIERMSGAIGFDSAEGQGSTFWVEFARV